MGIQQVTIRFLRLLAHLVACHLLRGVHGDSGLNTLAHMQINRRIKFV
jgi:hypothetical protein